MIIGIGKFQVIAYADHIIHHTIRHDQRTPTINVRFQDRFTDHYASRACNGCGYGISPLGID